MTVQARGPSGAESRGDAVPSPPPRLLQGGFSAQLRGVGLWDLVQMECLARSHAAVQVVGEGGVGYLYFDGGSIVHATTAVRSGEAAVLEILGWSNGTFQACDRPWPEAPTVTASSEALILEAAKRRDEAPASNLVAFPGRNGARAASVQSHDKHGPEDGPEQTKVADMSDEGEDEMGGTKMGETLRGPGVARPEPAGDFSTLLRLGPNGSVISNRGGDENFAQTIAYVHRLVQLAGELLGLEPFGALEATFKEGRCIVFTEGDGDVVALRPRPEAALGALRERLGL